MSTRPNALKAQKPSFSVRAGSALQDMLAFFSDVSPSLKIIGAVFLLSFCQCFNIPSSFSLTLSAALICVTSYGLAPFLGGVAALIMRLVWRQPMDYALLCGFALLLFLRRPFMFGGFFRRISLCLLIAFPRLIFSFLSEDAAQPILGLFSIVLSTAAFPAFCVSIKSLTVPAETLGSEEKACLYFLMVLLICGMGHLSFFSVNLGLLSACFLSLVCGYCLGYANGILAGLLGGAALLLCGFPVSFMAVLIACGLAAGVLAKKEPRLAATALFLLGGALAAVLALPSYFSVVSLHLLLSALLFLPLRKSALTRFADLLHQVQPDTIERDNSYAADMLLKWENAIKSIAYALPLPTEPQDTQDESAYAAYLRAGYERDMVITHLTAMAHAVKRLSAGAHGDSLNDLKAAIEIEKALKTVGFPGHLIYAKRSEGHLRAAIEADVLHFSRVSPTRLQEALYHQSRIRTVITAKTRTRIELEEASRFEMAFGHACIPCNVQDTDNGDAVLVERLPGGKQLIMLSDGMGHGEAAGAQSKKTLELLKLCLEAGYTREQAITAVNGMMLCATGGTLFATVDLFMVDLWTGLCDVKKLGACQSYFVRAGKIKSILGDALPLGVIEQVDSEDTRLKLTDGDYLILMSDGVCDAFLDEALLTQQLLLSLSPDAQKSADAFLRTALICAGGIPKDDMTVLILTLSDNPVEKASPFMV